MSTAKQLWIVSERTFTVTLWTLCVVAILFLASRFAVRASTKGKLMGNDYFLVAAVPILLAGFALLQSELHHLYETQGPMNGDDHAAVSLPADSSRRLVACVELTWIAIYCVKFCYLMQFKFYKPPYAYVVITLTRYYWTAIGLCSVGFLFTIVQPVILCTTREKCRYFDGFSTRPWEIAVTVVDIFTDILVMSIPIFLIYLANTIRSYTIANFVFKSLSMFNIVVAAARLAVQYDSTVGRVQYVSVTFLLVVEATIAIIMVSISSYRVVFLDLLAEWDREKATQTIRLTVRHECPSTATAACGGEHEAASAKVSRRQDGSLSQVAILSTT